MKDQIKLPPQAVELEEAVLGALLIEGDAMDTATSILVPEAFYKQSHEKIYRCAIALKNKSEKIDILTVTNELIRINELENVGGAIYVSKLTNRIASAANIEFHSRILMQKYLGRKIIEICSMTANRAYSDVDDIFDLSDNHFAALNKIMDGVIKGRASLTTQALVKEDIKQYEARVVAKNNNQVIGIPAGFYDVDKITTGWKDSDLIIVAARPSMGKTALVLCYLINAARAGFPSKIFSLETSAAQLTQRIILIISGVDSKNYREGNLTESELMKVNNAWGELYELPIEIDDNSAITINYAASEVRKFKKKYPNKKCLFAADYLQLFKAEETKGVIREQQISAISQGLKRIAKDNNSPFIALSQLSRAVETRGGDKRPQLSDLRDSGAIEQDADIVMFIYRPEYYGFEKDDSGNSTKGVAEIIIAKHRDGALGNPELKFIPENTKFMDKNDAPYNTNQGIQPNTDFTIPRSESTDEPF